MKKLLKKNSVSLIGILLLLLTGTSFLSAQEEKEAEKKIVTLRYFNINNGTQYVLLTAISKNSTGISPQKNKIFSLYLDSVSDSNLISKTATDKNGKAKYYIPVTLQKNWNASAKHTFLAIADEGTEDEQTQETEVIKSKIAIDTLLENGVRSIVTTISKYENENWVPVPDVEVKIGVKRLCGVLSGGEEAIYTTDSAGIATVEFIRDSLPGDEKGNLILSAKVDDNDELGNLLIEMNANWGVPTVVDTQFFNQRTLWSTRFRTPFWLLGIAYSIVIGVWGTLIYLLFQLLRIRKLGKVVK